MPDTRFVARLPRCVTIYEVGPRDGLQNESTAILADDKIAFVNELIAAGLTWIETTSFVNPRAVPQLADASEVMAGITRPPGVRFPVLVPNERGMERALESGVDSIALFAAASEAFSQANIRVSIDESFERFRPVATLAKQHDIWLRGYVSTAFHCPYSGPVAPVQAVDISQRLLDLGCDEVAIADTIGIATPLDVDRLLQSVIHTLPLDRLAMHFHDTSDLALANVMLSLEAGITVFDGAAGGLGGCPFAPGAPGNLATEKLVRLLDGLGIETGVDATKVAAAGRRMRSLLASPLTPAG